MTEPQPDRDAQLADLVEEARRELRDSGQCETTVARAGAHGLAGEVSDLLVTVTDLEAAARDWRGEVAFGAAEPATSGAEEPPWATLGRYRIVSTISSGGMGTVYRGHDPQLQRTVAIKVPKFSGTAAKQAEWRQRFLREAQAAAAVRQAHVCPIYDVGEQDGTPFIVMACLEGNTLADLIEAGPLDVSRSVDLIRKVALGLEAVHASKIVHRDLKPRNVLLDAAGEPHLTDFGLSRPETDHEQLTGEGMVLGTPAYMSPEQLNAQPDALSPRTDVYALGVLFYEMLTGKPPFSGNSLRLAFQITQVTPDAPSRLRPGISPALDDIVLVAMSKAPADRFSSARAFIDALDAAGVGPDGVRTKSIRDESSANRRLAIGLAIIAVGVLGFIGSQWLNEPNPAANNSQPVEPVAPTSTAAKSTLIVQTEADNYLVRILQGEKFVVEPTRERWFTLPAGEYDFELRDPSIDRIAFQKHFVLEPGGELVLDATLNSVFLLPEQPGAVRSVAEWVTGRGPDSWIQVFTFEGQTLKFTAKDEIPEKEMYTMSISLRDQADLTDADLGRLRKLNNLERLDLEGSPITSAALDHLKPGWHLTTLNLSRTAVDDSAIDKLATLQRLKLVDLTDAPVTAEGVARLRQRLPTCEVIWSPPRPR